MDLYVLGSTQEETHSTGAITAAYGIFADLCAAVDVTHGDSPDAPKEKTFPLGKGPVIGVGPNCTRWMVRRHGAEGGGAGTWTVQLEVMAGPLRHQRLAHADQPGGNRHGGALHAPAVYAHPH